jgi:hypothetical protein
VILLEGGMGQAAWAQARLVALGWAGHGTQKPVPPFELYILRPQRLSLLLKPHLGDQNIPNAVFPKEGWAQVFGYSHLDIATQDNF